jgi:thioredoxin 1
MIDFTNWMEKSEFQKSLGLPGSKIVVFAAEWCGYCRRYIAVLQNFKQDLSQKLEIVNVDSEDGSLWDEYSISLVPTIIVFKEGKEVFRRNGRASIGLQQKDLEQALEVVQPLK